MKYLKRTIRVTLFCIVSPLWLYLILISASSITGYTLWLMLYENRTYCKTTWFTDLLRVPFNIWEGNDKAS